MILEQAMVTGFLSPRPRLDSLVFQVELARLPTFTSFHFRPVTRHREKEMGVGTRTPGTLSIPVSCCAEIFPKLKNRTVFLIQQSVDHRETVITVI